SLKHGGRRKRAAAAEGASLGHRSVATMKRLFVTRFCLGATAFVVLLVGCTAMPGTMSDHPVSLPAQAAPSAPTTAGPTSTPLVAHANPNGLATTPAREAAARVDALLAGMSLERKVGQVLIVGFEGTALAPEVRAAIAEMHAGGIVYFGRNVQSPTQLATLSASLQQLAAEAGSPGLIICIDQEGGTVARLRESQGFTEFPSAMATAATGDPANARQIGRAIAEELLAVGINMDLAPDLDVNNNPANPIIGPRSFGSDPNQVSEYGIAYVEGLQDAGVAAVGKHFPGHGDTAVDSHLALPVVPHDRARLEAIEFVPFRAAMAARIAGIMSAHITFPAVDPTPGLPATLSPRVMSTLLRVELGYDGLLMTDSLEMGALPASGYPPPAAAATALAAGADVLLLSDPHREPASGANVQVQAYRRVLDDVRSGRIAQARLDEAVRRVLLLKARFGILDATAANPVAASAHVATADHRGLSRRVAAEAVTLLRHDLHLLPLKAGSRVLVIETPPAAGLGRLLGLESLSVSLKPADAEINAVVAQAGGRGVVVMPTADAAANPGQVQLVRELLKARVPLVVAAVGRPYDLLQFPDAPVYLATYGSAPPSLEALARVLRGEAAPAGRLPVDLPGLYQRGKAATER
ncbi:MAG TPA: beta-N-acetylhexosaminidase, partial [Anaerolineae bacterium]